MLKSMDDSEEKIKNQAKAEESLENKKLKLPLLFVECQPSSKIKISQDDTKMHMKLSTNQKFALRDENFLFDVMGLTKTNSKELSRIFDKKIIDFLKNSELVQIALPSSSSNTSGSYEMSRPIDGQMFSTIMNDVTIDYDAKYHTATLSSNAHRNN